MPPPTHLLHRRRHDPARREPVKRLSYATCPVELAAKIFRLPREARNPHEDRRQESVGRRKRATSAGQQRYRKCRKRATRCSPRHLDREGAPTRTATLSASG